MFAAKCFIVLAAIVTQLDALLYPSSGSSLSLTASVSVPINELLPYRRALVDWCFNMGYNLPFNLSSFYNIPIWANFGQKARRATSEEAEAAEMDYYAKYVLDPRTAVHPLDLSAGELYVGIEDLLSSYGFHDTCLLRSVCELARHPFDEDDQNVLTDVIAFLLTPSQHDGFLPTEHLYRAVYEEAEQQGFLGNDCTVLYPDCSTDILTSLTKIDHYDLK